MSESAQSLAVLNQANQLLACANTLEEIKSIRDKAEAARKYAESVAMGLQLQNAAAELKLRAERKAGEVLSQLSLWGGNRKSSSHDENLKLNDLGIGHNQSARWQLEAAVSEELFQKYVTNATESGAELTSQGLLRLARKLQLERRVKRPKKRRLDGMHHDLSRTPSAGSPAFLGEEPPAELLRELINHHELLLTILEPICENPRVTLKRIDQRTILRLLAEIREIEGRLWSWLERGGGDLARPKEDQALKVSGKPAKTD